MTVRANATSASGIATDSRSLLPDDGICLADATFHTLRHTCASLLFEGGKNIKQVQEWLGHADSGFTLRCYVHLIYERRGDADSWMMWSAITVSGGPRKSVVRPTIKRGCSRTRGTPRRARERATYDLYEHRRLAVEGQATGVTAAALTESVAFFWSVWMTWPRSAARLNRGIPVALLGLVWTLVWASISARFGSWHTPVKFGGPTEQEELEGKGRRRPVRVTQRTRWEWNRRALRRAGLTYWRARSISAWSLWKFKASRLQTSPLGADPARPVSGSCRRGGRLAGCRSGAVETAGRGATLGNAPPADNRKP